MTVGDMRLAIAYAKTIGCDCEPRVVGSGPFERLEHSPDCTLMRPEDWVDLPDGRRVHRSLCDKDGNLPSGDQ